MSACAFCEFVSNCASSWSLLSGKNYCAADEGYHILITIIYFQGHNMDDIIMAYVAYIMSTQIKKKPSYAGIVVGESTC